MRKPLTDYFLVPNSIVTSEKFQSAHEIALFISILRFCNWDRRAFLSINTLVDISKISKRSIFSVLKSLEQKQLIKIKRGKNRCNLYEITWNYRDEFSKICEGKNCHSGGAKSILTGAKSGYDKEISLKNSLKEMSTQLPLEEKKSQESSLEKEGIDDSNLDRKNSGEENILEENDFEVELLTPIDDETFEKALRYQENKMYMLNNKIEKEQLPDKNSDIDSGRDSDIYSDIDSETSADKTQNNLSGDFSEIDYLDATSEIESESLMEIEFEEIFSEKEGKFVKVPIGNPDEKEIHFEEKRKLYKEITLLIGASTGMGEYHAQNAVRLSGLTVEQLERLSLAIRESNFLSGRLIGRKPKLSHFSSFNQIFRILGGSYKNFEKCSYGYQQEYVPKDLKDAEPDFDD